MAGKITKVFNAADQIQAEVIHDHLKQNGIESISNELLYDSDYDTSTDEEIKLPWWQNKAIVAKCILGFFVLVIIVMIANQILQ